MDPSINEPVEDNGAGTPPAEEVKPEGTPQDGGATPDIESWKAENKVPYSRFEDVIRANQEYRDTFSKKLEEISEQINKFSQPTPQDEGNQSEWDRLAQSSKNWGEFISNLTPKLYSEFKRMDAEEKSKVEQSLNQEISALKAAGLAGSESEVNAILKFATDKSKELKTSIPLSVAAQWMRETSKPADNKGAAGKVESPRKSSGGPGESKVGYKDIKSKSLDEIILEAKENAPKG